LSQGVILNLNLISKEDGVCHGRLDGIAQTFNYTVVVERKEVKFMEMRRKR
jgi:hypothetical protein